MKIFVINPGSTSTKLALYDDEKLLWRETLSHSIVDLATFSRVNDQFDYRFNCILKALSEACIPLEFDGIVARGGLLKPTPGGVYAINDKIKEDLRNSPMEHACNLGGLLADRLASISHAPAFIADPEVVDERMLVTKLCGLPDVRRSSIFHALNSKAVARKYAASIGTTYEKLNLIVVHLGGGISVGAHSHGKVIDVNDALNGDGPFSPERAGTVPAMQLVELCYSGKYTLNEIKKKLNGKGGLAAYLGTSDVAKISEKAEKGLQPYKTVLDAMIYSVGQEVGARYVTLRGKVDAIILTGGIAHSSYCVEKLRFWIDCLGPVVVRAGEDELGALAFNCLGALRKELPLAEYNPGEEGIFEY